MELGMIGLGHMGGNVAQCLLGGGHRIFAYDANPASIRVAAMRNEFGSHAVLRSD